MTILFGGQGVAPTLRGQPTNVWSLQAGNAKLIPAGTWQITTGLYSCIQELDAITGIWRAIGSGNDGGATNYVNSDGNNFRIANQSGCLVGAIVTTAGAGYTTAPTVTPSNGNAKLQAIVGGAVSTTVTVTNGGTGYIYPPIVLFDAPNQSGTGPIGVQATGHATISAGVVTSVTVDDQGAGYTNVPNVYFQNDPRDAVGTSAAATAVLTGAGTVTAILVTDFGNAYSSTAVPTLSFSGTSTTGAAATAIMNWSIGSYSVNSVGGGYAAPVLITNGSNGFTATAGSTTNPTITTNLVRARKAWIGAGLSSGVVSATGQTVYDGGVFPGVPTLVALGFSSGSVANLSASMQGYQDTQLIQPV